MLKVKPATSIRHINSFFIEIIIVIFFFMISSTVIIQVFGRAQQQNIEAEKLNSAILKAQSLSESFSQNGDIKLSLESLFNKSVDKYVSGSQFAVPLDKNWCVSSSAEYTVNVSVSSDTNPAGVLKTAKFTISDSKKTLYEVTSCKYSPQKEVTNE